MSNYIDYKAPFYDGAIYSIIFDRMLVGVHRRVADWVDEGSKTLDVCCGPGGLSFTLAKKCKSVTGLDISEPMIARAEKLQKQRGTENITFINGDASQLDIFDDGDFDYATVSMGLHEMPIEIRGLVLPELLRVAERVVILDFTSPQPRNLTGLRNRIIERVAGAKHFAGFLDYQKRGGLPTMIEDAGAKIVRSRVFDGGTLTQAEVVTK